MNGEEQGVDFSLCAGGNAMNVTLAPDLEKWVEEQVSSGQYESTNDVLSSGIEFLRERAEERAAKLAEIKQHIQVGLDQFQRGEVKTYETADEYMDELEEEVRAALEEGSKNRT